MHEQLFILASRINDIYDKYLALIKQISGSWSSSISAERCMFKANPWHCNTHSQWNRMSSGAPDSPSLVCRSGIQVTRGPQNGSQGSVPTSDVVLWANTINGIVLPRADPRFFAYTETSSVLKALVATSNKADVLLDVRKGIPVQVVSIGSSSMVTSVCGSPQALMLRGAENIC